VVFELLHGGEEVFQFFVADEDEECGIDSGGVWVVGGIAICSTERFRGFADG
jgi:hypothetical protein